MFIFNHSNLLKYLNQWNKGGEDLYLQWLHKHKRKKSNERQMKKYNNVYDIVNRIKIFVVSKTNYRLNTFCIKIQIIFHKE